MKYFFLLLFFICGCKHTHVGIVHDYVIGQAIHACEVHGGLHYIAENATVNSGNECKVEYQFRCQDGALIGFNSEVTWCGIDEFQLEETFGEKK